MAHETENNTRNRQRQIALWGAIHAYVESCGGDPERNIQGNVKRQEAVVRVEALALAPVVFVAGHQPGNGTNYCFCITPLPDGNPYGRALFTWVNAPGARRNSMVVTPWSMSPSYIADKLDHPLRGDLAAICTWLRAQGWPVEGPE